MNMSLPPFFKHLLLYSLLSLLPGLLMAQDGQEEPFTLDVKYDSPLTIDLDGDEEVNVVAEPKKKKKKKNVYYGIKTKKGFTRTVRGSNIIIEEFNYIKDHQQIDPFVRDIYWYSFKRRQLIKSRKVDAKYGVLLHGPYVKYANDQVVEQGIFYRGMKHGRWITLDRNDILQDKEKYYKGWPKESLVQYWDKDRKSLREIIPVEYGEREGNYYYFHEDGSIGAYGEFQFDSKVGIWTEYYPGTRRPKRQIRYGDDPFDDSFKPFIMKEWDENGRVIYDSGKK